MHQEVNQILAQLSDVHIQLLGPTSKQDEFNCEFPPKFLYGNYFFHLEEMYTKQSTVFLLSVWYL